MDAPLQPVPEPVPVITDLPPAPGPPRASQADVTEPSPACPWCKSPEGGICQCQSAPAPGIAPPALGGPELPLVKIPPLRQPEDLPRPEWLTPELKAEADALEEMLATNARQVEELRTTHGIAVPAPKIIEKKFDALLDSLFDPRTKRGQTMRLRYERLFEVEMTHMLTQLLEAANEVKAAVEAQMRDIQRLVRNWQVQKMAEATGSLEVPPDLAGKTPREIAQIAREAGLPVPEILDRQLDG
jgi:hypothetical protein